MKVLFVVPAFFPATVYGGPMVSVYQLCRHLVMEGVDIRVLTTDANGPSSRLSVNTVQEGELEPRLRVRYCPRLGGDSFAPELAFRLPEAVRWADAVHLTSVYSWPTVPALLACRAFDRPLVWSPPGSLQRWAGTRRRRMKAVWDAFCRTVAPKRTVLHATAKQEEEDNRRVYPGLKGVVIPNGVLLPERTSEGRGEGLRLLYVGRIDPKKGVENLLESLTLLEGRNVGEWSLVVAGDGDRGYVDTIRARISALGLAGQVSMCGHVEGEQLEQVYGSADVVVVPSFTENFCNVVSESLARGIPVVASTGTPWASVEEKGCGLWVSNSPTSLSEAIARMASMPLREMGDRGRAWMTEEFSWRTVARKMIQAYEGVMAP